MYLDVTYINVRDDGPGQTVPRAAVIATGITADGGRPGSYAPRVIADSAAFVW